MKFTTRFLGLQIVRITTVLLLVATKVYAEEQSAPSREHNLKTHWNALLGTEPSSTRAILQLAKTPEATIAFIANRVHPLTLSDERLERLLDDLRSSDDSVWKAAFHELEYFDPRLALGIEDLLKRDAFQDSPARNRLVAVLSGRRPERTSNYGFIRLRASTCGGFNFVGSVDPAKSESSWWAEHKVERLNGYVGNIKQEWTRLIRAICLLEHFGTSESMSIVKKISKGHPDAAPTKIAKATLKRYSKLHQ